MDLLTVKDVRNYLKDKLIDDSDTLTTAEFRVFGGALLAYLDRREAIFEQLKDAVVGLALTVKEMKAALFEEAPATTPEVAAAPETPEMGQGGPAIPEDKLPFKTRADGPVPTIAPQTPGGGPVPEAATGGEFQNTSRVANVTPIPAPPKNGGAPNKAA